MKKQAQKPAPDWKAGIHRPVFDRRPGWKFPVYGHRVFPEDKIEVWYILLSPKAYVTLSLRLPDAPAYKIDELKIERNGTEKNYHEFRWGSIKQVTYDAIRKPFQTFIDRFISDANAAQQVIFYLMWYEFDRAANSGYWSATSYELKLTEERTRFDSTLDEPAKLENFYWSVNDLFQTLDGVFSCPEQSVSEYFNKRYR